MRSAERRGSWPNDTGSEASIAFTWRRLLKWRDGPALARHGFPVSMIGSIRPRGGWREGSSGNREEVVHRQRCQRCPFLAISMQQGAANGSKARHKAKVKNRSILSGMAHD